ncbi:rhomboid family intramembrane serine protease [Marivivens sp. LCG002]|uniref:rhomboid family intramembrane serine protease n=1 Tax=Marivivens sp. LCG002 TaxID=3051171 RepID=UPI002553355B|nr:rhomboid family intramembrane serine protease [Marivivens sp. LCG002]WIV50053.1 rhomboid family intramembrane serine protease [Marivivens sp. LCG002]
MFPIRDHNPSSTTPVATYSLIAANIAIFLYQLTFYGNDAGLSRFYWEFALVPARVMTEGYYQSFLTHMFLHGGFFHLAGNMLFLWIFGDNLEDQLGRIRYLGFYLLSGLGAGLAQFLFEPYSNVPMVGASGAIAGVMGGYLLLFPKARVDILFIFIIFFKVFPIPAYIMLGIWFVFQVVNGLGSFGADGGVAYWAHAGGFLIGAALMYPIWKKKGAATYWSRTLGSPPHPEARYEFRRTSIPRVPRRRR